MNLHGIYYNWFHAQVSNQPLHVMLSRIEAMHDAAMTSYGGVAGGSHAQDTDNQLRERFNLTNSHLVIIALAG